MLGRTLDRHSLWKEMIQKIKKWKQKLKPTRPRLYLKTLINPLWLQVTDTLIQSLTRSWRPHPKFLRNSEVGSLSMGVNWSLLRSLLYWGTAAWGLVENGATQVCKGWGSGATLDGSHSILVLCCLCEESLQLSLRQGSLPTPAGFSVLLWKPDRAVHVAYPSKFLNLKMSAQGHRANRWHILATLSPLQLTQLMDTKEPHLPSLKETPPPEGSGLTPEHTGKWDLRLHMTLSGLSMPSSPRTPGLLWEWQMLKMTWIIILFSCWALHASPKSLPLS